ncbi:PaaI family thioesterase [Nocardia sp. CA-290969]|uniref:PaaI family thioesterase n=1 Tax=Nocardia sp. CA-290969 TaxID=3239986 RepID=UPI003D8C52EF
MSVIGLTCLSVAPEQSEFALEDSGLPLNANSAVNGGIIAAAADQIMAVVAARASAPDYVPVTGSLHIQFHSPAHLPLTIRGLLLPSGFRTKYVEVVVEDSAGRRCATAHATMISGRAARRYAAAEVGSQAGVRAPAD